MMIKNLKKNTIYFSLIFATIFFYGSADALAEWRVCSKSATEQGVCKVLGPMEDASLCTSASFATENECKAEADKINKTPTPAAVPEKKDPGFVKLDNPLNLSTDVKVIIGTIIKGVLGIMGGLVLLLVVYGGSTWLMAAGNPEKVKAGSQTILWALLGAVITVASYIILSGIMKFF